MAATSCKRERGRSQQRGNLTSAHRRRTHAPGLPFIPLHHHHAKSHAPTYCPVSQAETRALRTYKAIATICQIGCTDNRSNSNGSAEPCSLPMLQSRSITMQLCHSATDHPRASEKASDLYPSAASSGYDWTGSTLPSGPVPRPTYPYALDPSSLAPFYASSRSSVSSSDSHLFSPKFGMEAPKYSPTTPPYASSAFQDAAVRSMQVNQAPAEIKRQHSAHPVTTSPIPPMQPGFISQLAGYMADMVVYLWYSPPNQKRAPTFPKPTDLFAGFCHDVLMTSTCTSACIKEPY